MLLAQAKPLLGRQAVERSLDIEDGVDPLHGVRRKRCACQLGQLE